MKKIHCSSNGYGRTLDLVQNQVPTSLMCIVSVEFIYVQLNNPRNCSTACDADDQERPRGMRVRKDCRVQRRIHVVWNKRLPRMGQVVTMVTQRPTTVPSCLVFNYDCNQCITAALILGSILFNETDVL